MPADKTNFRWAMFYCKIIPFPCFVWKQEDGVWTYRSHPFVGRDSHEQTPKPDWEMLEIGDVCIFDDFKYCFHLGHAGVLAQFENEKEAQEYARLYEATHKTELN